MYAIKRGGMSYQILSWTCLSNVLLLVLEILALCNITPDWILSLGSYEKSLLCVSSISKKSSRLIRNLEI